MRGTLPGSPFTVYVPFKQLVNAAVSETASTRKKTSTVDCMIRGAKGEELRDVAEQLSGLYVG